MSEYLEQAALMSWADNPLTRKKYPELEWLFHPANGGHRHIAIAVKLKKMGVRAGIPDLLLPVSRNGYHALWIEMKIKVGKLSDSQSRFIEWQRKEGAKCVVCYSWTEAKDIIEDYLKDRI